MRSVWYPITTTLTLFFLLTAAAYPVIGQDTYYISPDGSNQNSGTSLERPWKTFQHAFRHLEPGTKLILMDGTYTQETTGLFHADCEHPGQNPSSGSEGAPVVIEAQNERKAWIKGEGYYMPFKLGNCSWWTVDGLRVSSADNPEPKGSEWGSTIWIRQGRHLTFERMLVHHNNRYFNGGIFWIQQSAHVLVEESEIYYFHRNGMEAFRSHHVTYRRNYANSRGHADLPDGRDSHKISDDGGDRAFLSYYGSHFLVENCISENKTEGFGFISGKPVVGGEPSGDSAEFYGIISFNDNIPGAVQSRQTGPTSRPIRNVYFRDYAMIGGIRAGFVSRAASDLTMEHVTVRNTNGAAFAASVARHGQWPPCNDIGGCVFRLRHWLIGEVNDPALRNIPANDAHFDFRVTDTQFLERTEVGLDESIEDDEGQIRRSGRGSSAMLHGDGCPSFIRSPDEATGNRYTGARIMYRYKNGVRTSKPLWNPDTGAFPHGAVIDGINDVDGNSVFDVHERLGVTPQNCDLPYAAE